MAHANACLTPAGRLILCQRIAAGRPAGPAPPTATPTQCRPRPRPRSGGYAASTSSARIASRVGRPASTVHRVLVRRGLNRLAAMDRPTGRRGYAAARPALVAATWQPSAIASCWHRTTTQRTTT